MFAVIAAVLFGLALLLALSGGDLGVLTPDTLTVAGLLFVALHLSGAGSSVSGRWSRGRGRAHR